jgi:transcriptional regulator with XRE-family HTH domain
MNYYGLLLRRERIRRNWSQEGLCKGICAVSYLSKIEKGRAAPSDEILHLLLSQLDLQTDNVAEMQAKALAEESFELLFSGDFSRFRDKLAEQYQPGFISTFSGLDLLVLQQAAVDGQPLETELEACMNNRQLAIQRLLQDRCDEAIRLLPNAYTYYSTGVEAYGKGNYSLALEYLQTSYNFAAGDGAPFLMLYNRMFMGNCYSNQIDIQNMSAHYQVAKRLAAALRDDESLETIQYNTASTQIEAGRYEEAYTYFSAVKTPNLMSLHKLAICCEKTGRVREAINALDEAESMDSNYPETPLARKMCDIVRYRLDHADYMESSDYAELLLSCFNECRQKLPSGYASFHLPWVLEWFTATRQYKKAYDLMVDFPARH